MKLDKQVEHMKATHRILRQLCSALAVLQLAAPVCAQALRGQVLADQIGGAPLKGVGLSIEDSAVVTSGADGRFVIPAATSPHTASSRLSVRLRDHVVINDVLLEDPLTDETGASPLTLLMTTPSRLQSLRESHFVQQMMVLTRAEFSRKNKGRPFFTQGISLESSEKVAINWAVFANQGSADQMPPLYREGLRAWWRLDARQALETLSPDALKAQIRVSGVNEADAAQAWMLRAALQLATGKSIGAMETMNQAVSQLPGAVSARHYRAHVLLAQPSGAYEREALAALVQTSRSQSQGDPSPVADAYLYDTLGSLSERTGAPSEAREYWEKSYKLYLQLRPRSPVQFIDLASRGAINAALMQVRLKLDGAAQHTFADALTWRRELAQLDPTMARQFDIATTLRHLAQVQERLKNRCEAEAAQTEARKILKELAELDPLRFQERLNSVESPRPVREDCHGNRGTLTLTASENPALPTHQELDRIPPERWEASKSVWREQSSLHMTAKGTASTSNAAQWTLRVLDLQLRQDAAEPSVHRLEIARTLMRVASLHQMYGKSELALRSYQQALAFWDPANQGGQPHPWTQDIIAIISERIQELSASLQTLASGAHARL